MIELSAIFTPDLWVLLPLMVIVFAVEHLALASLAQHYPWAKLSKPRAYALGTGTLFIFFLIHAALNSRVEMWCSFALLTVAAGAVVATLWMVNPMRAEQMNPSPLKCNSAIPYNYALAIMENLAALFSQIADNSRDNLETVEIIAAYMALVKNLPQDFDPDVPVRILRRMVAQKVVKETK